MKERALFKVTEIDLKIDLNAVTCYYHLRI
jgi:hypothetical protein